MADQGPPGLPALPAAPTRLALPWGDSAYTTVTYSRWLHGDPTPDPANGWYMGPPGPLTPSSEGPRRAATIPVPGLAPLLARVLTALQKVL